MAIRKAAILARRTTRSIAQTFGINPPPRLCESILVAAPERNWQIKRLHDAFTLNFSVPHSLQQHPTLKARFEINSNLGFPAQYLVTIPQAIIKTSSGFIVTPDGDYLTEGHWRVANVVGHPICRNEWLIKKRQNLSGDWYCAMGHWGANYNHWLWDEMPRLLTALPHLPADTRFLVPDPLSEMQRDSLMALGIKSQYLYPQAFDCESLVERLWFATPLGHSEWAATAPDVAKELRQKFIEAYAKGTENYPRRRLYISRSEARYRRLLNEEEILPILEKEGFEVIRPENLSFPEQVQTFSQASIIMGVHGAGLTNMLFAPSGATIVEIHGPVSRSHYWMMSNILGHHYYCFVGDTVINSNQDRQKEPDFCLSHQNVISVIDSFN
ncbi:glycosyltransferase family 61 protein [Synechocystis sp. FACHB-383]|uniref:glycosyltransferase family 61 protein n=1 Tax=Synechocystis sp. FACHB-383 TaxID=2692864 RepID=UPI0016877AD3|nr:glycosyltransferase family 61 protein [Synechocystis sp. FACHB-383]MBD2654458.1 glycosyltransferase family 61 protein [Synechocystis sp. FACHB-383]